MQKKSIFVGIFLLMAFFMMLVFAFNTQADVTVDGTNYEIEIDDGAYDFDSIWANNSVNDKHLVNYTDGRWLLNWSLVVGANATFDPSQGVTGCTWIRLNATNVTGHDEAHISIQGDAYFNDTMITGWNYTGDCNMTYNGSYRPYIYIHPTSHTDTPWASFKNCTIGYLGFDLDNKYGIVYEDDLLESTDVDAGGYMHNCTVMENYQGITFQGCENMDVSDTYFNDTLEAGIVYTIGGSTGGGSHGGNIGDTGNQDLIAGQYSKVQVLDCHGDATAMGIRIFGSDNITMEDVEIINATTEGLWLENVNNLTASSVIVRYCTNAADDYQISLNNVTNSSFTSCSAKVPAGAAPGGNWYIGDSLGSGASSHNTFTTCTAFASLAHEDFYIHKVNSCYNNFTSCTCNNSLIGFFVWYANNNTFTDCIAHNHTYDYKIESGDYNTINDGFSNDSTIGVYIIDTDDSDLAHHNTVDGLYLYRDTSYGISIGSDGGSDNWCHNNTIVNILLTGTTTGDGVFFFDNVTYNNLSSCSIDDCDHVNASGTGLMNNAYHNTLYYVTSSFNGHSGLYMRGYVNNNEMIHCTFNDNTMGVDASGDNVNNNTIRDTWMRYNGWGYYAWPSAVNSNADNYINSSVMQYNDYTGIDIGRAGLSTYSNNTIKNNTYGVEVRQGAEAFFSLSLSYNHTSYDWILENDTTVDIYSTYILYPNVINTVGSATASISHDAGDGLWNLTTKQVQITTDSGTCDINLTQCGETFAQWTGAATVGNLTQTIGGLRSGRVYDLEVDHDTVGRASVESGTMLDVATYRVSFPYTDGWSTHTFTIRMVTNEGGGGGGGAEPQQEEPEVDTDGDGWTDAQELLAGSDPNDPNSTPANLPPFGVSWIIWIALLASIVLIVFLFAYFRVYPVAWKRIKKKFK